MSARLSQTPGPGGYIATLDGQEHWCEAPYSARVRLLTPEGRREVPRDDVGDVLRVWTTARWQQVPGTVMAPSPTGWWFSGQFPDRRLRQQVTPDELTDITTHRLLIRRRRPRWVLPTDPDPTVVGTAVRDGYRVLPAGPELAGLLPVHDGDGERLVDVGELEELVVTTSACVDGHRWDVGKVDGENLTLTSPERGTRRVSVHDVADVVEEVRTAAPRRW